MTPTVSYEHLSPPNTEAHLEHLHNTSDRLTAPVSLCGLTPPCPRARLADINYKLCLFHRDQRHDGLKTDGTKTIFWNIRAGKSGAGNEYVWSLGTGWRCRSAAAFDGCPASDVRFMHDISRPLRWCNHETSCELWILQDFPMSSLSYPLLLMWPVQLWCSPGSEGPAWPLYPGQPHPADTNKRALALAERTDFGPLVASVSPTETLNIEQLFYLMRQNFMAASIKLCQPSVLWQQRPEFFKVFFTHFFFFPPSDTQTVKMNRTRFFFFFCLSIVDARQVPLTKMTMRRNRALRREERSRQTSRRGTLWWHGVVVLWNSLHLALCRGSGRNCERGRFPSTFYLLINEDASQTQY